MARPTHPNLTRREAQIMEILHRRRRATVEEIRAELPEAPTPSSVRKLLDIMIDRLSKIPGVRVPGPTAAGSECLVFELEYRG